MNGTMNGTMNNEDNKLTWTQFNARLGSGECDDAAACDARFYDVEISTTPRRGATTTRDFERRQRAALVVRRFQDHRAGAVAAAVAAAAEQERNAPPRHETIERPKTRSARRAADDEAEREATAPPPAPIPTPTPKRERRSDYWITRDDQRRNAARTFKTDDRLIEEEDEEGMELED
jgi:hypothetical protein